MNQRWLFVRFRSKSCWWKGLLSSAIQPAALRTIEWRIDVTQCGREISYSQRNHLACTRPWRRVTSRVLSPYRWGLLLFVLHFNSAPAILVTWRNVSLHFSFSLSLFLDFLFLSLSLSLLRCLILALFLLPVSLAPSVVLQDSRRHKPPVENMFPKSNVNIDTSSVQIDKCVLRFWNSRNTTGTSTMSSVTWIERQ
jgi:hypothetical protein